MSNMTVIVITDKEIAERFLNGLHIKPAVSVKTTLHDNNTPEDIEAKKAKAIELLKQGYDIETVAMRTGLSVHRVRGYKAHITMGTY